MVHLFFFALLLDAPSLSAIEHTKTTLPVMHRCIASERFFLKKKSISYIYIYIRQRAYLYEH